MATSKYEVRRIMMPVERKFIVLELTEQEATALRVILGYVGGKVSSPGEPKQTVHDHVRSISDALHSAGVEWLSGRQFENGGGKDLVQSLHFNDLPVP